MKTFPMEMMVIDPLFMIFWYTINPLAGRRKE
jgi:hypothetical protein